MPQSFVLAVGGGSFLDLAGLAAALIHRGLRLIRVPSTVLAQNDSAFGVKTALTATNRKIFSAHLHRPSQYSAMHPSSNTLPDKYWRGERRSLRWPSFAMPRSLTFCA
jgi:3-dehydroquinate synthase